MDERKKILKMLLILKI